MIIDFTENELRELEALDDAYTRLKEETLETIDRLRPDDPTPDEEEYQRLQDSRPSAPPMPEPIRVEDGVPIYRKEDMDVYHSTPEYQAYAAENKRINDAVERQWDEWYDAGSPEWKAARERYQQLMEEHNQARRRLSQRAADRQFSALGDDPRDILEDAYKQIDRLIINRYNYYDRMRNGGSFRAYDVRRQDDGNFRLDTTEERALIVAELERHIKRLDESLNKLLSERIDQALATSPFVSDEGDKWGEIEPARAASADRSKGLSAIRPREYKRPNTKVHNLLFQNELEAQVNHFTPVELDKAKNVFIYANFVPPQAVDLGLDDFDERVYAAVGSCLFAGNNFIPFSMLYNRGILGLSPSERGRDITPNIERDLMQSLAEFDGRITISNDPTGERSKADKDFKKIVINEPLLFFQIREETVHGQVTRGIAIPSGYVPVGYRYGEINGGEITTDRIESIHVAGLNYSRDNILIANATYKRVKEIQYHNDQKRYKREIPENKRTITYEYIAERILAKENRAGEEEAKRNNTTFTPKTYSDLSQTERSRLKSKIDKCMSSYQKSKLFDHYEHKRDKTKTFYAVVIYFEPEDEKPKKLAAKGG